VILRDSPCGGTSKTATVVVTKRDVSLLMEKIKNFLKLVAERTLRVDTATVAVSDVLPHGLWCNVSSQRAREMEMVREMEIVREMIKSTVAQHHNVPSSFW
jgi:hypothetical protein